MLVEFLGLPGSGKTTLMRSLLPVLRQAGISACGADTIAELPLVNAPKVVTKSTDRKQLYREAQFRAAHPQLFGHLDGRLGVLDMFEFSLSCAQVQAAQEYRDRFGFCLIDTGLLMRGVDAHCAQPGAFARYLELVSFPPVLIHLHIDPSDACARTAGGACEDAFAERLMLIELAVAAARVRGVHVCQINAKRPAEDCRDVVLDALVSLNDRVMATQ